MKRVLIVACALALLLALGVSPALASEHAQTGPRVRSNTSAVLSLKRLATTGALGAASFGIRPLVAGGGNNILTAVELPYDWDISSAPSGTVDSVSHPHDVYWLFLEKGASLETSLGVGTPGSQIAYRVFGPEATDVSQEPLLSDNFYSYPKIDGFTAPIGGFYCVDIQAVTGSSSYTLEYYWGHPNDDISGVAAAASPIFSALEYDWNWDDVTHFPLQAGDTLSLSVAPVTTWLNTPDFDVDLYLHGPSSSTVYPHDSGTNTGIVAHSTNDAAGHPVESLSYVAQATGMHYSDVYDYLGNGAANLTWRVVPARPTIALSPAGTKLTYKRKKGKVIFTLNARFSNAFSLPYAGATTYLQWSKNGKSKWTNKIKLTTNADGGVGAKITAKKKSVGFYRWATKVGSLTTYGKVQKVTVK